MSNDKELTEGRCLWGGENKRLKKRGGFCNNSRTRELFGRSRSNFFCFEVMWLTRPRPASEGKQSSSFLMSVLIHTLPSVSLSLSLSLLGALYIFSWWAQRLKLDDVFLLLRSQSFLGGIRREHQGLKGCNQTLSFLGWLSRNTSPMSAVAEFKGNISLLGLVLITLWKYLEKGICNFSFLG